MSNLRVRLSSFTNKKVPMLALVVVAILGMVAGVLAASITVTPTGGSGQIGTIAKNNGNMSVTDQGLSIVSNINGISANTTATTSASNQKLFNGSTFTAGDWMETITFTDTADSAAHTVTIKINHGAGVPNGGTTLAGGTITLTITATGAGGTGTITDYIDLGVATITAPMTVYVSST